MSDHFKKARGQSLRARASGLLGRFRKNRSGVAATEFALLVPVMLVMYVGTVEITEAYYVDRRVTLATRVAGDLIARDLMDDQPLSYITNKVAIGINPMAPAKIAGLAMRITSYGIDGGGPANAPRAFVDWQVTCNVAGYDVSGGANVTCSIGTQAPFTGGLRRCDIDTSISANVMRRGTPLLRIETQHKHLPILAGLFGAGHGSGWFGFMTNDGFLLERSYFTWPRPNTRNEGPTSPAMTVKANASSNQNLEPADPSVCQASGIPASERFVP